MHHATTSTFASKLLSLREAISAFVHDGASVAIEGFTANICFAAAHEIMRQGRRNLTLIRMTPDVIYDQMIAAGVAEKLIFSYLGNPGVGNLYAIRRAIEGGTLAIEEYSHYGMVGRYTAAATGLPFFPLHSYIGSDLVRVNPQIRFVSNPYGAGEIAVVPPLSPDVAILHAPRADERGNTHLWGLVGVQKEVAFAAKRVIVVAEELVDEAIIRADPNRTLIPHFKVDAVVVEPFGAHPSYVLDYYDRDNDFYRAWDAISRDPATLDAWLQAWVYGVADRAEYAARWGLRHEQ